MEVIAAILNLVAIAIYCAGLISPLTPSEGTPSIPLLAIFAFLPLLLLATAVRISRARYFKAILITQCIALVGFTAWLLVLQSGVSANGR